MDPTPAPDSHVDSAPAPDSHVDSGPALDPTPRPVVAGTFPQYRLEPTHQGIAPPGTALGPTLELVWKTEPLAIGEYSASKSSPAVDVDVLYIGVDDGRLHAVDLTNGEVIWSHETPRYEIEMAAEGPNHAGIHGTPAFDSEYVYVGDYSGWMVAVEKTGGERVWDTKLGGSIGASPTLVGDLLFISVEYPDPDGKISILDRRDGTELWESPRLGNHPHSSTTVDPERKMAYVGANNGHFFCFDYQNYSLAWEVDTGGDIKSTAAVVGDTVYITSWSNHLHAYDADTGAKRWSYETGWRSMSSPSVHNGRVYFGSHDRHVYAVDASTGDLVWKLKTDGPITSSPTVVPDSSVLVIGSHDTYVRMVDLSTGQQVWSHKLGGIVSSVPVAVGDSLYVNDFTGTVWRFQMLEDSGN